MFQNFNYVAPDENLWTGRSDSLPSERFFQKVRCIDVRTQELETIASSHAVFLGFCSDAGIKRNLGRPGARLGPNLIKQHLAKLAVHNQHEYIDLGNILCESDLETAQTELAQVTEYCQQLGHKTIVLGGGHEIAWGHFQGLTKKHPNLGIINFDAHFDLRPVQAQATSGTPFWQIQQYCVEHQIPFSYACIGIQPPSNTKQLFDIAQDYKVRYLTAEQVQTQPLEPQLHWIDEFIKQHDALYLTLCMDVFAESAAPGVSAPQPLGLLPWHVFPLLKYIQQTGKVVGFDIAELSPPLDENEKTARLAAAMLGNLLNLE